MNQGVDLSTFQRNVAYAELAKAVSFGFVKCSDGVLLNGVWRPFEDDRHQCHVQGLRGAGTPTGDYAFGHPSMDVNAHADFFVSKAYFDQLRPVIDMESLAQGHTPAGAGDWCATWLERVAANTGVRGIVYAGPFYGADMLKRAPRLANWDFWEAAYPGTINVPDYVPKGPWGRVVAWQWTGSGSLPGVVGNADRDVAPDMAALWVGGSEAA